LDHTAPGMQALLCAYVDAQPDDRCPSPEQLRQLGHAVRLHHLSTNFLVGVVPLVAWLYDGQVR
jgi:hypothetical protein